MHHKNKVEQSNQHIMHVDMFGLFKSKYQKDVESLLSLNKELMAAARMAYRKDTDFAWGYLFATLKNITQDLADFTNENGKEGFSAVSALMRLEPNGRHDVCVRHNGNLVSVGRLILRSSPRAIVYHKDGFSFNLRRENLTLINPQNEGKK